jgi:hypothetical protein
MGARHRLLDVRTQGKSQFNNSGVKQGVMEYLPGWFAHLKQKIMTGNKHARAM